jgi:hypothetical protein
MDIRANLYPHALEKTHLFLFVKHCSPLKLVPISGHPIGRESTVNPTSMMVDLFLRFVTSERSAVI